MCMSEIWLPKECIFWEDQLRTLYMMVIRVAPTRNKQPHDARCCKFFGSVLYKGEGLISILHMFFFLNY